MATESTTSLPVAELSKRWPIHAVWIGLVLTLAGKFSYFLYFYQFPSFRDFPILNLLTVLIGIVLISIGCWGVLRHGTSVLAKLLATACLLVSLGLGSLFYYYVFIMSYQLPESASSPVLAAEAPDFTLKAQTGQEVSLTDFRGQKVVLVFYRGHW